MASPACPKNDQHPSCVTHRLGQIPDAEVYAKAFFYSSHYYVRERDWHYSRDRETFIGVYQSADDDVIFDALRQDINLFTQYYVDTAKRIGEMQLEQMDHVLQNIRDRYLAGPEAANEITQLAYSLRDWLPFVAYAHFVILDDVDPKGAGPPARPELPELKELERTWGNLDDLDDIDWQVDESPETESPVYQRDQLWQKATDLESLEKFSEWRSVADTVSKKDPRMVVLSKAGPIRDDTDLRAILYDRDPVLILLARVATPKDLIDILRLPTETRNARLRELVAQATNNLEPARKAFQDDLLSPEIPWERYQPLLEASKELLFPLSADVRVREEVPRALGERRLRALADAVAEKIKPWTWQDTIGTALFVASLALVVVSMGTSVSLTLITTAGITLDLAGVGINIYLNHLENEKREMVNRFAHVDAALKVASPEIDVTREALLLGAIYLVSPILSSGIRLTRDVIIKRLIARSELGQLRRAIKNIDPDILSARLNSRPLSGRPGKNEIRGYRKGGRLPTPDEGAGMIDDVAQAPREASGQANRWAAERGTSHEARDTSRPRSGRGEVPTERQAGRPPEQPLDRRSQSEIVLEQRQPQRPTVESVESIVASRDQEDVLRVLFHGEANLTPGLARRIAAQNGLPGLAGQRADDLLGRIGQHWRNALPRSGNSAQQEVRRVWNELLSVNPDNPNEFLREHLFDLWRDRAMRRIGADRQLLRDLEDFAGILKQPGTNVPQVQAELALKNPGERGTRRTISIKLNVDHANIRHEDAVSEALRTQNPDVLLSTIDPQNLALRTARENQHVLEALRKQARHEAQFPRPTGPVDVDVDATIDAISAPDQQ